MSEPPSKWEIRITQPLRVAHPHLFQPSVAHLSSHNEQPHSCFNILWAFSESSLLGCGTCCTLDTQSQGFEMNV